MEVAGKPAILCYFFLYFFVLLFFLVHSSDNPFAPLLLGRVLLDTTHSLLVYLDKIYISFLVATLGHVCEYGGDVPGR